MCKLSKLPNIGKVVEEQLNLINKDKTASRILSKLTQDIFDDLGIFLNKKL